MTAATPSTVVSSSLQDVAAAPASRSTRRPGPGRPRWRGRRRAGSCPPVSGSAHAVGAIRVGCSRLELRRLARRPLPAGVPAAPLACALRRGLRHGRDQHDVLPAALARRRARGGSQQTPPGFVFAVKSSRYLTHIKRLTDMDRGVGAPARAPRAAHRRRRRWARCSGSCRPTSVATTSAWPSPWSTCRPGRHAFEFRHPSWFADESWTPARPRRRARIGDHPERPWQPHELTADFTFVRLHYGRRGRRGNYGADRARRLGARARAPGAARGRLRLLQQRLGGLRGSQRFGDARAPRAGKAGAESTPRRDLLCF